MHIIITTLHYSNSGQMAPLQADWTDNKDVCSNLEAYQLEVIVIQADHLSGKPGNVGDFTKNQGNVRGKILSGKVA